MRDSGLAPAPVALDARQQRLAARFASPCEGSNQQETYNHPRSGALICRVIKKEHESGREAETMRWPCPDEEPSVKMVILSDPTAAKREAKRWATEREANVGAEVWMRWTDGSQSHYAGVGTAVVCKHRDSCRAFQSDLGTGRMELNDAEQWAIGLALRESVKKRDILQTHGVTKVAVLSDSQEAIPRTEHQEPGPGQHLARWISQCTRNVREAGKQTEIHWVPGHTGIPGNEEADRQVNVRSVGSRPGTV